jgi:neutral ceramidase
VSDFRAGAAARSLTPPLGLPMPGFVRSQDGASGWGLPLETTALVLDSGATRVVLCGVDTLCIQAPEVDRLRQRVARVSEAQQAGVLLNWNHTHRAPPSSREFVTRSGLLATDGDARFDEYADFLAGQVVAVARDAVARLEPARIAWGVGAVDHLSVNRRDRAPNGAVVHGWRADGLLDRQVVSLQARRRDASAIATLVGFGCHTVSVGMDVPAYSSDYPGALRRAVRSSTGGEAVFMQGAGGNVNPLLAFNDSETEAVRMGERLALEAVHSLADRSAWPRQLVRRMDASLVPMINFRFENASAEAPSLAAAEERLAFPLLPAPSIDEVRAIHARHTAAASEAAARGAGPAERLGLLYHAKWARRLAEDLEAGRVASSAEGPVNAIRIGDGAIVTGPGEVFTEIGMAVKERSPGRPTLYCGYTNGAVSYFSTAAAYDEGGYEPAFSNRTYGLPAQVDPACERLLIERGVRIAETLFPDCEPYSGDSWTATGTVPDYPPEHIPRPGAGGGELPDTAAPPG